MARIGATDDTSTKLAATVMPVIATPRPMSAVSSGSPIATTEPNEMSSTTMATPMPISSDSRPGSSTLAFITSPPNWTSRPASCAVAPAAVSSSIAASDTSEGWPP